MTLSICHREANGKIIQDYIRAKTPPFNPEQCVKEFAETIRVYGVEYVKGDKYSGKWCSSAFEKQGIIYENSELTKSEIYLEFLPLVMQGQVDLLDHKQQTIEFRQLERRTGKGRDSVDHPKGLHDDFANVCAGSLVMTAKEADMEKGDIIFLGGDDQGMKEWEKAMI